MTPNWKAERYVYVSFPYVVERPRRNARHMTTGFTVWRLGMGNGPGRGLGEWPTWADAERVVEIDKVLSEGTC